MTQLNWTYGGLRDLTEDECWEALSSTSVGRVAFVGTDGIEVLPVNHLVGDDHCILFRTAAYTTMASGVPGHAVAFECDDVDDFHQAGWSVLVQGRGEVVGAREVPPDDRPQPWAEGARSLVLRIRPTRVSGRRVLGH